MNKHFVIALLVVSLVGSMTACQPGDSPDKSKTNLVLEEHPLESPPDPDTMTFLPVGSSQEAVLAQHQTER